MYNNNEYNAKAAMRQLKDKDNGSGNGIGGNVFSANYEYSLAIEKCNRRLEKLKNEKNQLIMMNRQYTSSSPFPPQFDPRHMMFPMRQPVVPNPMMYAYQFIPPKMYEQAKMPQMSQPFPGSLEKIQTGMKLPQNNINTTETGFNYSELASFINGMKGYKYYD